MLLARATAVSLFTQELNSTELCIMLCYKMSYEDYISILVCLCFFGCLPNSKVIVQLSFKLMRHWPVWISVPCYGNKTRETYLWMPKLWHLYPAQVGNKSKCPHNIWGQWLKPDSLSHFHLHFPKVFICIFIFHLLPELWILCCFQWIWIISIWHGCGNSYNSICMKFL